MTNPNWGLLQQNGPQNALMQGLAMGQGIAQRREARDYRNALLEERQDARRAQQEAAQRAESQNQAQVMRRLLKHAEQSPEGYAQALGAAQQLGIDVSGAPQQYDPSWVAQQRFIMDALESPQGKEILSTAGKQAHDEGYQQGTPEFASRVRQIVNAGLTQITSVEAGGTIAGVNRATGETNIIASPSGAQADIPPLPPGFVLEGDASGNASSGFQGN